MNYLIVCLIFWKFIDLYHTNDFMVSSLLVTLICKIIISRYACRTNTKIYPANYAVISENYVWLLMIHSSIVDWGTMLQAGRLQVSFLIRPLDFSFHLIVPAHYVPGADSGSNRNEHQESSCDKEWLAHKAESLTAAYEPVVYNEWEPRCLKPYGPPRPVTGITLMFLRFT
jgi:hypothetical protein